MQRPTDPPLPPPVRDVAQLQAEIRQDLEAANAYIAEHGSFAEMVRRHYGVGKDD